MSEEPGELSESALNAIYIIYMVVFTVLFMVSIWIPYVAVAILGIRWIYAVLNSLRSESSGE